MGHPVYLVNNVEDVVVFGSIFNSDNFSKEKARNKHFIGETTDENDQLKNKDIQLLIDQTKLLKVPL